ncbi:UNVERIFIED_CONTAM: Disease resistance protein RPP13 [Sesamum latifolium]|uniref:Disease resistance protein RPP13 n=1 Tax=Sesamum latifolium TaxID=2727402 RepID=A0AAW2TEN9_9LAMI
MAYSALVSVAETLSQILKHHQHGVFLDEKRRLQSLRKHVMFLRAFLEDFPEKAKDLEDRIRHAANEAEDITELLLFEEIRSSSSSGRTGGGGGGTGARPSTVDRSPHRSGSSNSRRLQKMCQQLQKVIEAIDSIVEEVMGIKNSLGAVQVPQLLGDSSPPTTSSTALLPTKKYDKKDAMVGFEEDLLATKTRLCGGSCKLEFVPIYGMGGIGKTTLARNAYGEPLIVEHFDIRAWLTVSQDYSIQEMLFALVDSIKAFNEKFDGGKHTYEQMAEQVYKSLKGRRYLVVLDDMWSTKAWDDVKRILPDDGNSSRIIITTRLQDVAAYADSSSPLHEMRFMDVDQSWILLRQKVFNEQHCPPELESTGKMIARSCKGLPLAIVVIAGILSTVSQTQASWEDIAEKVNLTVSTNDGQFARILSLSYTHLPHHLRPFFLYMGCFPEDYEIHVSKLFHLWMAEGFMKPSVSKSFEERAEVYLEDLVKRSLVLVTRRKSTGQIKSCSVHDLVRDLCIRKARKEKFLLYATDRYVDRVLPKPIKDQRRVSIPRSTMILFQNIYSPTIRTALYFQHCRLFPSSLKGFRLLRVLDALKVTVMKFPAEVLELFHLKYLAFTRGYHNLSIPASISKLQNLQTLFIYPYRGDNFFYSAICFPAEIWGMAQLRHLVFFMLDPLSSPCARSFALENLQTLSLLLNFRCSKRLGQIFPSLKKLGLIYGRERVLNWEFYGLHNLVHLHQLEKLKISMRINDPVPSWEKLAFPTMLKKLTLGGFVLSMAIGSLLVLKLKSCSFGDCKWETSEGEFAQLKFLKIETTNLKHWITETSHFPTLERFLLYHCGELREIPDVIGEIPTLELIEVKSWKMSLVESAKRIKQEQQDSGNEYLQVRILTQQDIACI